MNAEKELRVLAERWTGTKPGERANFQLYVTELAAALDVQGPLPKGSGYEFELPVRVVNRDGTETTQFADLSKQGCFLLEAKDEVQGVWNEKLMRAAYGQAIGYVNHLPGGAPPYILVLDVASTSMVWDGWSGYHGGFNAGERIDLPTLDQRPEDIALLRDIWENPSLRDPRGKAEAVTTKIAEKLAGLASSLESRGHDQEDVARFLMRCVFTMFSEDVGLLEGEPFLNAIRDIALPNPKAFQDTITDLWAAMDQGKEFHHRKLLQFNGHFFRDHKVLPLDKADLQVLLEAAEADWRQVEPSIFGTLLTRALDPVERHRLGAEFTPRIHVERVVRPTVETPIRDRWKLVEMEVFQLQETGKDKQALKKLREFHGWLRSLRFLDPACGSGNFLYVTLEIVKRIEAEVIRAEEDITGHPDLKLEEVGPWQFHGLEIKPWAREIAELTLWIGYHQFWERHHEGVRPPEPVLHDTGTLEQRDAVLAWDEVVEDSTLSVPDPSPRIQHPVTGDLVPDPDATIPHLVHHGARQAVWPKADFIIGNPPYMGQWRQREEFGSGYVEALRAAYPGVPDTADYVMYWWYRAAQEIAEGRTLRAGLITTNTIRQSQNRTIIESAQRNGVFLLWAVPDHPWVDELGAANVRVSMTVLGAPGVTPILVTVDDEAQEVGRSHVSQINSDLTSGIDIARASEVRLRSNEGLCVPGYKLHGQGFILSTDEANSLLAVDPKLAVVIRPYLNGRDVAHTSRGAFVIDFGMRDENEAREFPVAFDIVRDRVKPHRDTNRRATYRRLWWRFGEARPKLREVCADLTRFIATVETCKHRFFVFLDQQTAPDNKLICIGLGDHYHLGVLSSSLHVSWALAAGGRLEDRPVFTKSLCFDPFPFPVSDTGRQETIGYGMQRILQHREEARARDATVSMTAMYNVVASLRAGKELSRRQRHVHEIAACRVLLELHESLDCEVAGAYGWQWPLSENELLSRLVKLHDARVGEEESGKVRWLRPDYQIPRFGEAVGEAPELKFEKTSEATEEAKLKWPTKTVDQIVAIQESLLHGPGNLEEVAKRFHGTRRSVAQRHLETLVMMGEVRQFEDGCYHAVSTGAE